MRRRTTGICSVAYSVHDQNIVAITQAEVKTIFINMEAETGKGHINNDAQLTCATFNSKLS